MNARVRHPTDPIEPLLALDTGLVPDNFPHQLQHLQSMDVDLLNPILDHYGLSTQGNLARKRARLQGHLGISRILIT